MPFLGFIDRLRATFTAPQTAPGEGGNVGALLFSLALAFVLWFAFSMRKTYTVFVAMPVEVQAMPEGQALRTLPPRTARVQVQGVGWELLPFGRTPPPLQVQAQGNEVNLVAAATESKQIPAGLSVLGVNPAQITLDLEERITRTLPIRLRGEVGTAALYETIGVPVLSPDSVRVAGARSVLAGLDAWYTERLAIEGADETFAAAVPLADTLAGLVVKDTEATQVEIEVGQFTETTRLLDVRVEGAPQGVVAVRTIPARVTATFRVPADPEQFDRALETDEFYAFVPFEAVQRDTTGTVRVLPHPPPGLAVRDVRLQPQRLRYLIRME
jgi:hypothetical protein